MFHESTPLGVKTKNQTQKKQIRLKKKNPILACVLLFKCDKMSFPKG